MFEAFDLKHKNAAVTQATVPVPKIIEEIRFEKVQFAYPGTDRNVLQDISLTLHRGETFGLVAENGSGKTTLVKLLCRLYDPTQGRILVNGIDIRCFSLYEWQSAIGVLLQEYGHYEHLTVRTAIALGREPDGIVDERQVVRAAQAACCGLDGRSRHGLPVRQPDVRAANGPRQRGNLAVTGILCEK
jgi:ATP-binding cassette subfamily B protein